MFLQVLSVLGSIVGFLFLVLSIASGLYYISELVEEHTEPTKRLLRRLIYGVTITLALLMIFDGFPKKLTFFSIFTYWVYLQNLEKFPYVQLTSPIFLASCVLVVANHFLWYDHFHNPYIPSIEERLLPSYTPPRIPSFVEVCSFFGLCVWFVPFALFVSLYTKWHPNSGIPNGRHEMMECKEYQAVLNFDKVEMKLREFYMQ